MLSGHTIYTQDALYGALSKAVNKVRVSVNNNSIAYILYFDRVGPMVTTWCIRMEAKNSYFKRIAQLGNFVNLPLSVAKRHQRLLCAHLQGKFFLYDDLECGPCKSTIDWS